MQTCKGVANYNQTVTEANTKKKEKIYNTYEFIDKTVINRIMEIISSRSKISGVFDTINICL